jgi:hypothetical protein
MKLKEVTLFLLCFVASPSVAKNSITVDSGDLSVVKNSEITATVLFDYTDLRIEGKPYMEHLESKGKDYVRDWPTESLTSESYFMKCWNHDNEDGMQVTSTKGNDYTMVFVVSDMDMGSGAASAFIGFGAGGAKMSGKMYIIKGNSNIPVLTVTIDGQSGRTDLYGELAEDLVDAINKTKQSKLSKSTSAVTIPGLNLTSSNVTETTTAVAVPTVATTVSATTTTTTMASVQKNNDVKMASQVETSVQVSNPEKTVSAANDKLEILAHAKGKDIPRRRIPVIGNYDGVSKQRRIGVYVDFSDAEIMEKSEREFIKYMKMYADRVDLDPKFDITWETEIKPDFASTFCEKVNKKLKEEGLGIRFMPEIDYDYVLKFWVREMDDDGDNVINFLFVNMSTGEVEAQIKCESDGGRSGSFVGLMSQGIESAAENFAEMFVDKIK